MYKNNRLNVLYYLFRFRFLTQRQLAQLLHQTSHVQTSRILKELIASDLVVAIPSTSIFIPQRYRLTAKGITYLEPTIEEVEQRNDGETDEEEGIISPVFRRNRNVSLEEIEKYSYQVEMLLLVRRLKEKYAAEVLFLSKSQLYQFHEMPTPRPDGWISISLFNETIEFCIEIIPAYYWRKATHTRIEKIRDYYEEEYEYDDIDESDIPRFVFIPLGERPRRQALKDIDVDDSYGFDNYCDVIEFDELEGYLRKQIETKLLKISPT